MSDPRSRAGTSYFDPEILAWAAKIHVAHDEALATAFATPKTEGIPAIQVGPSEGKLLGLLLRMVSARRVVEVGTLAGYSTIHLARSGAEVDSIELDERHATLARENLRRAGVEGRTRVHVGRAAEILPMLTGPYDAVFLDADKGGYDAYGRWAAANLRPGGLLLADNVFLFGRLLGEGDEAAAMRRFHEEAARAFDSVVVPTPDGLLLGLRRA
jgi:caffeoyl-CoA O-methyltransferase